MTKRQVWRYKCDFCGKQNLSSVHMARHERHCTANPNRICRMCAHAENEQRPLPELIRALDTTIPGYGINELRELASGCPMCMLAAVRQSGIGVWDGESHPPDLNWDFRAELKKRWTELNNEAYEREQERVTYER